MKYDYQTRTEWMGADDDAELTEGDALITEANELCVRLWALPTTPRVGRLRLRAMQRYARRVTAEYGHYEPEPDGDENAF